MRIVVKVGSAVLTQEGEIAVERMQSLVDFLANLKKSHDVILVSSGAVAGGYTKLKSAYFSASIFLLVADEIGATKYGFVLS